MSSQKPLTDWIHYLLSFQTSSERIEKNIMDQLRKILELHPDSVYEAVALFEKEIINQEVIALFREMDAVIKEAEK
jgi:hypothetical protein